MIYNDLMHASRHRHLIAFPLFALCFGLIASSHLALGAVLTTPHDDFRPFFASTSAPAVWRGTQGTIVAVDAGGGISVDAAETVFKVLARTVTLRTFGYSEMIIDDSVRLALLNGAVAVLPDARGSTIVALTAPVLVQFPAGDEHILPVGYQVSLHEGWHPSRIPLSWLDARRKGILSMDASHDFPSLTDHLSSFLPLLSSGKYEEAAGIFSHSSSLTQQDRMLFLHFLFSNPSKDASYALLTSDVVRSLSSHFRGIDVLVLLSLGAYLDVQSMESSLFSDSWHVFPPDEAALAIGAQAAFLRHPLPDFLLSLWQSFAIKYASVHADLALPLLLPDALDAIDALGTAYPRSARVWREATSHFLSSATALRTPADHQDILHLLERAGYTPVSPALFPASSSSAPSSLPPAVLSDDLCAQSVTSDLLSSGVMFTTQTRIQCLSDGTATISSVSLSTRQGDRLFDFHYRLADHSVFRIVRAGIPLPNTLPLKALVESLQK